MSITCFCHEDRSLHPLLEAEHAVKVFSLIIVLFTGLRVVKIGMMGVEEFHDMETALVYIEVDVPGLEVGGACLPDLRFGIQALHLLPRCIASKIFVDG